MVIYAVPVAGKYMQVVDHGDRFLQLSFSTLLCTIHSHSTLHNATSVESKITARLETKQKLRSLALRSFTYDEGSAATLTILSYFPLPGSPGVHRVFSERLFLQVENHPVRYYPSCCFDL